MELLTFDWAEYVAFALTLLTSVAIGIYFATMEDQNTITGYVLGGRKISVIPISISLAAAYVSGVTLLGLPNEVYLYGTQVMVANIFHIFVAVFSCFVFLPVFYKLQLISTYEYLELRFGHGVRIVTSILFTLHQLLIMPVFVHGVAMALNQVTGIDELGIACFITAICVFYTALGGLRAVVWTDAIQGALMALSILIVLVLGIVRAGGVQRVISIAYERDRIEFANFNPDPTQRLTFWSTMFGVGFQSLIGMACSPETFQRSIALPSLRHAQKSLLLVISGMIFFGVSSGLNGLVLLAEYQSCDPLLSGLISKPDQIMLHFVLRVCGKFRGLSGLFLAGIVSAGLSSMSALSNTLAATCYRDLIRPFFKVNPSEGTAVLIMKGIIVILGAICVINVYLIKDSGNLTVLTATFVGLVIGPMTGVFLLGLLFPWATNKGAIWGGSIGILAMTWLSVAQVVYKSAGHFRYPTKPLSVDGCLHNFTRTAFPMPSDDSEVPYIYRITIFYNIFIGLIISVGAGLVVSYLTGFNRLEDVDPELISPVARRFLPNKGKNYEPVPLQIVEKSTEVNSEIQPSLQKVGTVVGT